MEEATGCIDAVAVGGRGGEEAGRVTGSVSGAIARGRRWRAEETDGRAVSRGLWLDGRGGRGGGRAI